MKKISFQIVIVDKYGKPNHTKEVEGVAIGKYIGIHQVMETDNPNNKNWSVTHLPSGLSFGHFIYKKRAEQFARGVSRVLKRELAETDVDRLGATFKGCEFDLINFARDCKLGKAKSLDDYRKWRITVKK